MILVGLVGSMCFKRSGRRHHPMRRIGLHADRSGEYLLGKNSSQSRVLATVGNGSCSARWRCYWSGARRGRAARVVEQYPFAHPPAIVFVAAVAVLFESIRWLSGKLGDVFYFFLWMTVIGLVVANEVSKGAVNWARCVDFTGFGFMIDQMQRTMHTESVSIGASSFDPAKPTVVPRSTYERGVVPRLFRCSRRGAIPVAACFSIYSIPFGQNNSGERPAELGSAKSRSVHAERRGDPADFPGRGARSGLEGRMSPDVAVLHRLRGVRRDHNPESVRAPPKPAVVFAVWR